MNGARPTRTRLGTGSVLSRSDGPSQKRSSRGESTPLFSAGHSHVAPAVVARLQDNILLLKVQPITQAPEEKCHSNLADVKVKFIRQTNFFLVLLHYGRVEHGD